MIMGGRVGLGREEVNPAISTASVTGAPAGTARASLIRQAGACQTIPPGTSTCLFVGFEPLTFPNSIRSKKRERHVLHSRASL